MRKLTRILLPMLNLVGLLVASCGPQEEPLQWEKIAQYEGGDTAPSPDEQPRLVVIVAPEQIPELEPYVYSFVLQEISQTNFSDYLVVVVFQGHHGVANYSVEVEDVKRNEGMISIDARFLGPVPGEALKNIESSPYYVLQIRKTPELHGEFIFVLVANGEEIMRQSQIVPFEVTR